ncbi:MAG: FCSD flavin-binding domain-containing protein [Geminicoccaceae bacterium]
MRITRRDFGVVAGAAAGTLAAPAILRAQSTARLVVIGGGPGGATVAKYVAKDSGGAIDVTLINDAPQFTTCFYSNLYLGGMRSFESITHSYDTLAEAYGINMVIDRAVAVDPSAKTVALQGGNTIEYDALCVAPGIDMNYGAIEGYDEAAAEIMPHAWKAGAQTQILKQQIEAMPEGGLFIMVAPPNPYRCPPGPYERACLVAHYFKQHNPSAKILILDPKDKHSKQGLFQEAFSKYYPGMIEWVPGGFGGTITAVDPGSMMLISSDGDEHTADVANVIPAQVAGLIARDAGLTDDSGWCPIEAATMASTMADSVYVVGDACIPGDMPKSGFSANSQAKVAAMAIRHALTDAPVFPPRFRNTCWSTLAEEDAVKVGANYEATDEGIKTIDGFISETGEDETTRLQTKNEADGWYDGIVSDVFS